MTMASARSRASSGQIQEVDLHGLHTDQAEARILRVLDEQAGREGLVIHFIHGKGLGVLADLVERIGRRDPRVASVERSFFNAGMTGYTLSGQKVNRSASMVSTPAHWNQPPPPVRKRKR
jgi:dsDNA-specific endonuclease/ATPase MutS2